MARHMKLSITARRRDVIAWRLRRPLTLLSTSMCSRSLLVYLSLVLSSGIGVLAQSEEAVWDVHPNTKAIIGGAVGGGTILVVVVIILFFVIRRNREDSDGNRQPKSRHPADAQWESIFRYYPNASSGHTLVLNLPPEPHQHGHPSTPLPPGSTRGTGGGPSTSPPPQPQPQPKPKPRPKPKSRPRPRHPADAQWESIFRYNPDASNGPTLVLNLPPEPRQHGLPSTSLPLRSTPQTSADPSTSSSQPRGTRQTNADPSTSPPPVSTRQTSGGPSTSSPPRSTPQTSSGPSTPPPSGGTDQTVPPVTRATPAPEHNLENVETFPLPLTPPPAYTPLCED